MPQEFYHTGIKKSRRLEPYLKILLTLIIKTPREEHLNTKNQRGGFYYLDILRVSMIK